MAAASKLLLRVSLALPLHGCRPMLPLHDFCGLPPPWTMPGTPPPRLTSPRSSRRRRNRSPVTPSRATARAGRKEQA
nr:unnamed protein product [Digitaria exilis]